MSALWLEGREQPIRGMEHIDSSLVNVLWRLRLDLQGLMVLTIEPAAGCTANVQTPEPWHTNVNGPFFSSVSPAIFYTAHAATRFQSTPTTHLAISHSNQSDIVIRHSCEVPILPVASCRLDCEASKTQGVKVYSGVLRPSTAMNTEIISRSLSVRGAPHSRFRRKTGIWDFRV
jgi:hypothetical protein